MGKHTVLKRELRAMLDSQPLPEIELAELILRASFGVREAAERIAARGKQWAGFESFDARTKEELENSKAELRRLVEDDDEQFAARLLRIQADSVTALARPRNLLRDAFSR